MSRAWALAVIFFILAVYAAFDSNPGAAIVLGLLAVTLIAIGCAGRSSEVSEYAEDWQHEHTEDMQALAPWTQELQRLRPDELWRSSAPIPCGVQVTVQIEGTFRYSIRNAPGPVSPP
jgi:hypothetical protein